MRSARAPETRATVIMANMHWYMEKTNSGIEPGSVATFWNSAYTGMPSLKVIRPFSIALLKLPKRP